MTSEELKDYLGFENYGLYCGTYSKYNNGSIYGQWIDLETISSYDEFMDVCRAIHSDEDDPEFMFQDYTGIPSTLYNESGYSEEEFDKIIEFIELDDDKKEAYKVYCEMYSNPNVEDFEDRYYGKFDSEEDFAEYYMDNFVEVSGDEHDQGSGSWMLQYFDYTAFARTLFTSGYNFYDGYVFY